MVPSFALAQTLADKVPGDVVVYVGWAGGDTLGPEYGGSHLKAILEASSSRSGGEDAAAACGQGWTTESARSQMLRMVGSIADPMWRHPSAFYFRGLDLSNPNRPQPRLTFLCDAGADADALKAKLDLIVKQAGKTPVPIAVSRDGNLISVVIGPQPALEQASKPLAEQPNFISAMAQVGKSPVATVYVDVDNLVTQIDDATLHSPDPTAKQNWPKVHNALGVWRGASGNLDGWV